MLLDWSGRGATSIDSIEIPREANDPSCTIVAVDVSSNRISSFETTSSASSNRAAARDRCLAHIEVVNASKNPLRSLMGIDVVFPRAKTVDVSNVTSSGGSVSGFEGLSAASLGALPALQQVIAAKCNLEMIDFDSCIVAEARRRHGVSRRARPQPSAAYFGNLRKLDVSRNQLTRLPRVSHCVHLTTLDVSSNRLTTLHDVEESLPLTLQSLDLSRNELEGGLGGMVPLGYLGQSLIRVHIGDGNPGLFRGTSASGGGSRSLAAMGNTNPTPASVWGPLLLWLAPLLQEIDGAEVPRNHRDRAGTLFRHADGSLSEELIALLDRNDATLATYIRDGRVVVESDRRNVTTFQNQRGISPPPALPVRHNSVDDDSDDRRVDLEEADATVILSAVQKKLRHLDQTVRHLWQRERLNRRSAALKIQAWFRGCVSRRSLERRLQHQRNHHAIGLLRRIQLRCTTRGISRDHVESACRRVAAAEVNSAMSLHRSGASSGSSAASDGELVLRVKSMDRLLRQLWGDFGLVRSFIFHAHERAARTIQKHYRGYKARKVWHTLKADLDAFRELEFLPHVRRLQQVGRRYLFRRRLILPLLERRTVRTLQKDVADLKDTVRGLQHTIQLLLRERRTASLSTAQ